MRKLLIRRLTAAVALGGAFATAFACSAGGGGGSGVEGAGNSNGPGSAGFNSGLGNGSAATGNIDLGSLSGGPTSPDGGCQHVEVNFVPKIPDVFVLVDRSGSMFDSKAWDPLKAGVLDVVMQLQAQIQFGFSAFSGQAGGTCPIFNPVSPALNNFAKISQEYGSLGQLMNPKGETPVGLVLPKVADLLKNDGNAGDKYILFVTDGEPDFCDDGDKVCPVDDVVSHLQTLKTQGITTIVFGIKSTLSDISDATLQAFANAGAGLPVGSPFGSTTIQGVCYNCQGSNGWKSDWTVASRTPDCATAGSQTLGTYASGATDPGGMATVYRPDAADQQALTDQIASVVSGIKSCTFDIGGQISVDLTRLSEASVSIEGNAVPLSTDNGWTMSNNTQLTLVGSACSTWRDPKNTHIDFNFPCDIIMVK